MRNRKIPLIKKRTELPKFDDGGMNNTMYGGASSNKNARYAAAATSVGLGTVQSLQASNDESLNSIQRTQGIQDGVDTAQVGVATAINPLLGAAVGILKTVGKGVRTKVDQTDEQGNLKNENASRAGQIVGAILDPAQGLLNNFTDPNATSGQKLAAVLTGGLSDGFTNRHKNQVESSAKAPLLEAQRLQSEQDAQNAQLAKQQELQNNIMLNAAYGGKMPRYAMGGMPNAEVEGGENTLAPDGSTTQFEGPSHEQGGIPTQLQPNEMVFSDRLKMPGTKKTFAELNESNNTEKEDKVLDNKKSDNYKKLSASLMKMAKNKKSLDLYNAQETVKQVKLENYAKKLGINMGNISNAPQQEFAYGGDFNPETDDPSIGFKNMLENKYDDPSIGFKQMLDTKNDGFLPQSTEDPSIGFTQMLDNKYANQSTAKPQGEGFDYNEFGKGLLQNAGNITSLIMAGKLDKDKYDRVTPELLGKPNLLDPSQALRDTQRNYVGTNDAIKNASNGNSSTYINSRLSSYAGKNAADMRIRQNYDNANAGIKNEFAIRNNDITNKSKYFNADTQKQEFIANQMNKGQRRNVVANSISNIGQNVNSQIRDNNADRIDAETLDLITKRYPEMMNDPEIKKAIEGYKTKNKTKKEGK